MLIEGQRVADKDGIGAIGVELTIGLVGDLERLEVDAAIKRQWLIHTEQRELRSRMVCLVRALLVVDRWTWYRLHVYHFSTDSSGGPRNRHGNQAIKNPA